MLFATLNSILRFVSVLRADATLETEKKWFSRIFSIKTMQDVGSRIMQFYCICFQEGLGVFVHSLDPKWRRKVLICNYVFFGIELHGEKDLLVTDGSRRRNKLFSDVASQNLRNIVRKLRNIENY